MPLEISYLTFSDMNNKYVRINRSLTDSDDGSCDHWNLGWSGVGIQRGVLTRKWCFCGSWLWSTDRDSATAITGVCCHGASSRNLIVSGTSVNTLYVLQCKIFSFPIYHRCITEIFRFLKKEQQHFSL